MPNINCRYASWRISYMFVIRKWYSLTWKLCIFYLDLKITKKTIWTYPNFQNFPGRCWIFVQKSTFVIRLNESRLLRRFGDNSLLETSIGIVFWDNLWKYLWNNWLLFKTSLWGSLLRKRFFKCQLHCMVVFNCLLKRLSHLKKRASTKNGKDEYTWFCVSTIWEPAVNFIIIPPTSWGGYTGIALSVRLSVRPSVCPGLSEVFLGYLSMNLSQTLYTSLSSWGIVHL